MSNLSLGTIEVFGLPAAVEAADVACKTANVQLIGYETTDGMGMVAVKIEGQVSAVQSAVAAASAAAARVSKVFATSVIARPSEQLASVVMTAGTVGLTPEPLVEPVEPTPDPTPEPLVELVETTPGVSTSSTSDDAVETSDASVETAPASTKPRVARRPATAKSVPTKK